MKHWVVLGVVDIELVKTDVCLQAKLLFLSYLPH